MEIVAEHAVEEGQNRRFALRLADGAEVEAVLYRGDTLCVSSQVGCAVRCPFCASGRDGLARHLTLDELEGEVSTVERELGRVIERLTVSGVGEPLHNAENVASFVRAMHARGKKTSLTTSGGPVDRLARWLVDTAHLPSNGLTISIHAGSEEVRARVVPHGPRLAAIFETLAGALPRMTGRRKKKLALAYLVLEGENDGDEEVDRFVERARPLGLAVHLYALNPTTETRSRGSRARYEAIHARMVAAGLVVRMSSAARLEANGGCGTLVALRKKDASRGRAHA